MEESGRPRDPHKVEIAGSNPAPATTSTQPDEGSADCLPAICSGGNGGATGAPAEPVSSRGTQRAPHPSETSAYWRERARQQLAFAKDARSDRRAPVESIQIYERNAREYLAQAERIDRAEKEPQVAPRDPLTDPHPGDVVMAADGAVLHIMEVTMGHGACVRILEDWTRYALDHEQYREAVRGGRVVERAGEAQS